MHSIKKVLILEYTQLPEQFKKGVRSRYNFHKDVILQLNTEMEFGNGSFSRQGIDYWRTNKSMWDEEDTFTQTFDSFVKEMNLEFEVWIMDNFDLSEVEAILIDTCW